MQVGLATKAPGVAALATLAAQIKVNADKKKDYIADTRDTMMEAVAGVEGQPLELRMNIPDPVAGIASLTMNDLAHRQLASHVGIHATYYDRLRAGAPELLAANVNHWLTAQPAKRMVRTMDGRVRAYLSDAYQRIEYEEVAEVALPVLAAVPELQVTSAQITDSRLYIQATTPRIRGEVKKGDVVQAGVLITDSEVGQGAVSVAAVYWRLWCGNGAVSMDTFRKMHVGRRTEDTEQLWAEDTRRADDRAVLLKVRDMVALALDEVRFGKKLQQMQALTDATITGKEPRVVEVLAKKVGLSGGEAESVLDALIKGKDLTAWGVVNAVTFQAHGAKSYDRAVEYEKLGGALIDMAPSEWKQLLAAA